MLWTVPRRFDTSSLIFTTLARRVTRQRLSSVMQQSLHTPNGKLCAFLVYTDPALTADVLCFFSTSRYDVSSFDPAIADAFAARRVSGIRPLNIVRGEPLRLLVSSPGLPDPEVILPTHGRGVWKEIGVTGVAGIAVGAFARRPSYITVHSEPPNSPGAV
jgi:hypothetical protein